MKKLCLAAAGLLCFSTVAHAGGDAGRGAAVFRQCAACHSAEKGVNRVGPSLFGVVDRPTASLPDFSYSAAMKAFGADGNRWDEKTFSAFLQAPRDLVPGIAMTFPGLRRPQDIADVIAYLRTTNAGK